ncbi:MAG: type I glyceraldehyde-3-phosphate dehydrogenase [Candidatus Desulforudis sp.]|nr:type I glyceraldehyde-3-phosphate dehydrogenase [Desulforudis sp.]
MALRLGINGFGRIGRLVLRAALAREDLEVVGVNHRSRRVAVTPEYAETLLQSLVYDSVHGRLQQELGAKKDVFLFRGKEIKVTAEGDPAALPWGELGADIVIESTGVFRDATRAAGHIQGGAKKVIITAPGKNEDITIVMGVNEALYDPRNHHIVSNASCTTNCLAPVAKVLHERFGIQKALMNTVHAYTNDQQLLDMPYKDPRRGRAAALSVVPTTTGAAKAVGLVLPELEGRINGFALRVPVPNVSVVDLVAELARETTKEEVNAALREAAEGELKGILAYQELPLVSSDYNGDPHSATVDGLSTMVLGGSMVRVVAWYDNEWGYSMRVLDLAAYMGAKGL